MSVYQGLMLRDRLERVSDPRIRVARVTDVNIQIEFPEEVNRAYVQATNWFPNDRITFEAITIYGDNQLRNLLTFERLRNSGGTQSIGWFSFLVDTGSSAASGTADATGYREG